MHFCLIIMENYLNIVHIDFLANVRMLKFGSELRYVIRSPNVRTPVDIPTENAHLKPVPAVLSHHEMTLTLNTHTPLLNS